MKKLKLFWLIFPPFFLIVVFAMVVLLMWSNEEFHQFYTDNELGELMTVSTLFEKEYGHKPVEKNRDWQSFCHEVVADTHVRLTVMDPQGVVLGDSHENPLRMDQHNTRPEVQQALAKGVGQSHRFSQTLKVDSVYVAKRMSFNGTGNFIVRFSLSASGFETMVNRIFKDNLLISSFWLLVVFLFVFFLSKVLSQPIETITSGVERIARGNLTEKLSVKGSVEVHRLADTINTMAGLLNEKINTIIEQKNEQSAAFASMKEGMIAMDMKGRIIEMNSAARTFLQCENYEVIGRPFTEVVRNSDLLALHQQINNAQEVEAELEILEPEHKIFKIHGTQILGRNKSVIGQLFVLDDTTKLRKLEQMRKQFVANVSHELKTPLTSIKGYVETLLDSVEIKDDTVRKFLEKIETNANRLNSLIEDLLTLSRVEQEGLNPEELSTVNILKCIESVLAELHPEKFPNLKFEMECDATITVKAHQLLLQQAIFNLLDNATKYSEKEGTILIKGMQEKDNMVSISVRDQGMGIDAKHLPHLLERFYRVDKARSRSKGGTGLGLSIVKHIVQAHFGKVHIESKLGVGSTFTITIPHEMNIKK